MHITAPGFSMNENNSSQRQHLHFKRLGIDTYREFVVYMHRDCEVCRSEGFAVRSRVTVHLNGRSIVATLNTVWVAARMSEVSTAR